MSGWGRSVSNFMNSGQSGAIIKTLAPSQAGLVNGAFGTDDGQPFVDPGPRPGQIEYAPATNADGTLVDNMRVSAGDKPVVDKRGIEALRDRALTPGESAWAKMQNDKLATDRLHNLGDAQVQSASATSQANSNLAMRGGLSSGARERIQSNGATDLMTRNQQIGANDLTARQNVGIEDEKQRMDTLRALPGLENTAVDSDFRYNGMKMQADQYNTTAALSEKQRAEESRVANYQEQMKAWAAANQANAMAKEGRTGKK